MSFLCRHHPCSQVLDTLLAREPGAAIVLRDTDRTLARLIGALLSEAGAGSPLFADVHPVAAVEAGGGIILTADPDDLSRLAAPYRTVVIEPLAREKGKPALSAPARLRRLRSGRFAFIEARKIFTNAPLCRPLAAHTLISLRSVLVCVYSVTWSAHAAPSPSWLASRVKAWR